MSTFHTEAIFMTINYCTPNECKGEEIKLLACWKSRLNLTAAQTGNSSRLSVPIEAIPGASVVTNLSTIPVLEFTESLWVFFKNSKQLDGWWVAKQGPDYTDEYSFKGFLKPVHLKGEKDAVSILTVTLIHIYLLGLGQIFRDCSFPVSSISTTGRIYFLRRRSKGANMQLSFLSPSNFSVFLLPARRWIVLSLKMQCSRGNDKLSH